jgi:hypothetical protein
MPTAKRVSGVEFAGGPLGPPGRPPQYQPKVSSWAHAAAGEPYRPWM